MNQDIYQLKATLKESKPPNRLHLIIQDVMGWTNSHLYRFDIGDTQYGIPDLEDDFNELHFVDSRRTKLSKVVPCEKARFAYEYDFGDSWEHQIQVERILSLESGAQCPVCLAGRRACPPEDCGGIWGYDELLEIIREPLHEEYHDTMEWLGGSFDPEEFDIDQVNRLLRLHQGRRPKHPDVPEVFRRAFQCEDEGR